MTLTSPFYAPFQGIVPSDTLVGSHPIVWPIVIAIVAYMILHAGIRRLLRLVDRECRDRPVLNRADMRVDKSVEI